jgi:tetratricopeptide (TPR) repeat protein
MASISEALALAVQHHRAGRLQAAENIYRQILEVEPRQADALHLLGLVAHQLGKHEAAAAWIERAIGIKADEAAFHNSLGAAYRGSHRLPEAVACYRRALELKPEFAAAYSNLGNALRDQGNLDEAVVCYHRALALKPDFANAHNNLGVAFKEQGKLHEAVASYRRGLALKPSAAETHTNLGVALEQLGDLQGAADSFYEALRYNSRFALAHYKLAELMGAKLPEKELAAQRELLRDADLTDAQRSNLHFGLALALDARGEYVEAAEHLKRGNALQLSESRRLGQTYDPIAHESFISQMIKVCGPDFFERLRDSGSASRLPVFIFGLPRSGTTLIEQILASHSRVYGAGELRLGYQSFNANPSVLGRSDPPVDCIADLDPAGLNRLAAQHEERLQALTDGQAERVVDKMPDNYLYLGLLAAMFPQAVFIHCRRDLRDVATSCWMAHFQELRWTNDQEHIACRIHEYQRLMEHWRRVLPVPLLEVDYEETVADLEGVARKLVTWCGLPWEPTCLAFHQTKRPVRTASAVQVRHPVFKTSVGRWAHYQHALASLFARLDRGQ